MKIEEVDKLVEPLGWERDLCHDGDCFPELNENTLGHEGSYKKFNMTEHGEDGYISYQSLNEIIEAVKKMKGTEMSELEKTAPNEIYLIVGDTDKDCNFNELAEVTWADKPIYEETAIKYVKSSQLTIPKSIADELDGVFAGIDATDIGYVLDQTGPYGSRAFVNYYFKNKNIIALYLAGKALGVDLVKVVEG